MCGIIGIYNAGELETSRTSYNMLHALQHRGQDGCGLAAYNGESVFLQKNLGLVNDVFDRSNLTMFDRGRLMLGHVLYETKNTHNVMDTQPMVMYGRDGFMALGYNGQLVNGGELCDQMQKEGHLFQTKSDAEIFLHLISRETAKATDIVSGIRGAVNQARGSFAMTMMTPDKIIGIRDPLGMRPLAIGRLDDSWFLASESCALDAVHARLVREVEPGEIVVIDREGLHSYQSPAPPGAKKMCVFEYVYFARPDTEIDGISVYSARYRSGQALAAIEPVEADIVAGVPDSAVPAAMGYAYTSGIPFAQALIKSPYTGRTFIEPGQKQRERTVLLKLSPIRSQVQNKRIILVDDSIVRGTNSMLIVNVLRQAGAKEVHMRIASPPVRFPCHFGINTPSTDHLIGARHSIEGIRECINADSLAYLHEEALYKAVLGDASFDISDSSVNSNGPFCMACFNGSYPMAIGR
ncbi:MAG: amidophosphoribosyltransferase [Peptococcaceae bacterium]|nr:amidophosphoribosyltransferase [Peptococcaceae bacterium]